MAEQAFLCSCWLCLQPCRQDSSRHKASPAKKPLCFQKHVLYLPIDYRETTLFLRKFSTFWQRDLVLTRSLWASQELGHSHRHWSSWVFLTGSDAGRGACIVTNPLCPSQLIFKTSNWSLLPTTMSGWRRTCCREAHAKRMSPVVAPNLHINSWLRRLFHFGSIPVSLHHWCSSMWHWGQTAWKRACGKNTEFCPHRLLLDRLLSCRGAVVSFLLRADHFSPPC